MDYIQLVFVWLDARDLLSHVYDCDKTDVEIQFVEGDMGCSKETIYVLLCIVKLNNFVRSTTTQRERYNFKTQSDKKSGQASVFNYISDTTTSTKLDQIVFLHVPLHTSTYPFRYYLYLYILIYLKCFFVLFLYLGTDGNGIYYWVPLLYYLSFVYFIHVS